MCGRHSRTTPKRRHTNHICMLRARSTNSSHFVGRSCKGWMKQRHFPALVRHLSVRKCVMCVRGVGAAGAPRSWLRPVLGAVPANGLLPRSRRLNVRQTISAAALRVNARIEPALWLSRPLQPGSRSRPITGQRAVITGSGRQNIRSDRGRCPVAAVQ